VALKPSYYIESSEVSSFLVLRSLDLKQPLAEVKKLYTEDLSFPSQDVWNSFNAEQIINLSAIDELCESYSILQDPKLPHFECPNGMTEIQYLTELCREGWRKLINGKVAKSEYEKYAARVKQELRVIELANLSGYFLIVWDFIKQARDQEVLVGPGRGCFLPDTRVKLSDGNYYPISHISIGDSVIDAFGQPQVVYDTLEYDVDEDIIELEFENGKIIRCTSDHKFLTSNRGWVEAGKLDDSDDIVEV
jgi:hypothetical protein